MAVCRDRRGARQKRSDYFGIHLRTVPSHPFVFGGEALAASTEGREAFLFSFSAALRRCRWYLRHLSPEQSEYILLGFHAVSLTACIARNVSPVYVPRGPQVRFSSWLSCSETISPQLSASLLGRWLFSSFIFLIITELEQQAASRNQNRVHHHTGMYQQGSAAASIGAALHLTTRGKDKTVRYSHTRGNTSPHS